MNPYHDARGRFTSKGGAAGGRKGKLSERIGQKKAAPTYEYAQMSRPTNEFSDRMMAGTLKNHMYPDEVDFPLFHGSRADFTPGDLVEPGHRGNFVRRMKHVYAADTAERARQYGAGKVYEVRPLGPIGHRRDARKEQGYFASEWPYQVVRRVDLPPRGRKTG